MNSQMQDIHDIQPLWSVPIPWFSLAVVALILLGILGLAAWLVRRWWKKRAEKPKTQAKPVKRPSPRQGALQALKQLKAEDPERFYFKLEGILKQFLEDMHNVESSDQATATAFTATEVVRFLREQAGPEGPKFRLEALLERGVRAKFATAEIAPQDMRDDLKLAQDFVQGYTL